MNVHVAPRTSEFETFLAAQQRKDVLRFIACGSVDDGKSTLIGRLLHDTRQLFEDQLTALERDSRRHGTQGDAIDYALLVDGLSAEREQGITIDVAYRFFATDRRTFIVADTPGHEQYTRNMATGASTADLAVLLVDARKGLTQQTRRHSLIVSMLGIRQVVLAINKMDLVGWSQDRFEAITQAYGDFAATLGFTDITAIPMSALNGDNVVHPATLAPWYDGAPLVRHLENVRVRTDDTQQPFRLPVQWVSRPNADFRGYAGLIASGTVARGARVRVMPAGQETAIARIVTAGGDLDHASAGQSVVLTLADNIDVSRGDVIAAADAPMPVSDRIAARIFWMSEQPLQPGATFQLNLATASAVATVEAVHHRVDPDSTAAEPADGLANNEIGDVSFVLDRPMAFDPYANNHETGAFILIDRDNADTSGMGLVLPHRPGTSAEATKEKTMKRSRSTFRQLMANLLAGTRASLRSAAVAAAMTPLLLQITPAHAQTQLLNVSYDPTRELYRAINQAFMADWKAKTGETVTVRASHSGSGAQARAVIDGLNADVVTLALAADINAIARATKKIPPDWQKRLPDNSAPYTSTIIFLVRKGNPKHIKDWDDLVRNDVTIITPNPKTSGGARWNYLAAWGYALDKWKDENKARDFVTEIFKRVPVLDTGARGATLTFARRGLGDVLLAWENEAFLASREFGADKFDIVVPSISILAEPPVALVDGNVDAKGTRKVAQAYLEYLYTPKAQAIIAKNFYRPRNREAASKDDLDRLPNLKLFTIDQVFGGWDKVQKVHFDDGGVFDAIMKAIH
jgi:sulfate adenylyltransferase subunit 1